MSKLTSSPSTITDDCSFVALIAAAELISASTISSLAISLEPTAFELIVSNPALSIDASPPKATPVATFEALPTNIFADVNVLLAVNASRTAFSVTSLVSVATPSALTDVNISSAVVALASKLKLVSSVAPASKAPVPFVTVKPPFTVKSAPLTSKPLVASTLPPKLT